MKKSRKKSIRPIKPTQPPNVPPPPLMNQDAFVSRFMHSDTIKDTFPDETERKEIADKMYAIATDIECLAHWIENPQPAPDDIGDMLFQTAVKVARSHQGTPDDS